jgi:hypothetical protein
MTTRIQNLIGRDEARRAIRSLDDDQLREAWRHLRSAGAHEPLAIRVLDAIQVELEERRREPVASPVG